MLRSPLFRRVVTQTVYCTLKPAQVLAIARPMSSQTVDPRWSKKHESTLAFNAAMGTSITPSSTRGCTAPSVYCSPLFQVRMYGSRRHRNWDERYSYGGNGCSSFKKGALFALGVGAVVTLAPIGFSLVFYGAAGYGLYSLYQRFVRPYRYSPYESDPYSSMSENIERMMRKYERARQQRGEETTTETDAGRRRTSDMEALRSIDALVEGMPFVVRGFVKTIFSFANHAMQQSMERAGELRRVTNMYLRSNPRILEQVGEDVSISTPQNWMEQTLNGVSRVEAVFSVDGDDYGASLVTAKAVAGASGAALELKELKYHNHRTGEVIDLLADGPPTQKKKKTVVEADFVEHKN